MAKEVVKVSRSSSPAGRRTVAKQSFCTAAECIGEVVPGMSLFAITRGQFSMIDAVLACLDQAGPARVSLWTWTVAEYEVQCLNALREDGRLAGGRLVIDYGARNKNAGIIADWKKSFGGDSVRYVVNHAKIATIENERFKILLRGSMNLNFNPRFEQLDVTEGGPDFDLVREIEDELPILADTVSGAEAYNASRVSEAFDANVLPLFKGVKVWAK
jgi:hypothetical protein